MIDERVSVGQGIAYSRPLGIPSVASFVMIEIMMLR